MGDDGGNGINRYIIYIYICVLIVNVDPPDGEVYDPKCVVFLDHRFTLCFILPNQ